jgi:hypothetical protein
VLGRIMRRKSSGSSSDDVEAATQKRALFHERGTER